MLQRNMIGLVPLRCNIVAENALFLPVICGGIRPRLSSGRRRGSVTTTGRSPVVRRTPPMRLALALAALVVASPAMAQLDAMPWSQAALIPCRTYLTLPGTPLYASVQNAVENEVDHNEDSGALGSSCNIGDYTRLTCLAHPRMNLEQAVQELFHRLRHGQPLPRIPMCGA